MAGLVGFYREREGKIEEVGSFHVKLIMVAMDWLVVVGRL